MKAAVILLPGLNRDRDMIAALTRISGQAPQTVWQTETSIDDDVDLIVIPGGFSYGDYLRCGAIAGRSPIMKAIVDHAARGGLVMGVCNGFQILTEAGLLPGALMRNAGLKFVCKKVRLSVENDSTFFTRSMSKGDVVTCPVAHHDGNYFADAETLKILEGEARVVFRYAEGTNPNGAINDIAGIMNEKGNVIGMMPHPENMIEPLHGPTRGGPLSSNVGRYVNFFFSGNGLGSRLKSAPGVPQSRITNIDMGEREEVAGAGDDHWTVTHNAAIQSEILKLVKRAAR
jgi:phosphoribosylformylglycinamidine synthase I